MYADSGATLYHSITQETSAKNVQYNENHVENATVKTGNEFGKESKLEIAAFTQTGHFASGTDPLPSEKCDEDSSGYASGLHTALENTVSGAADVTGNVVAAYYNPFETSYRNPFEDDTYFFTDKSVTDIDLPELPSCYKDGTYYVVKDICIDMGVPSLDKILEENDGRDQKGVVALPIPDLDEKGTLKREVAGPIIHVSNSFDATIFDGRLYPVEDEVAANNGTPEKPLMEGGGIAGTKDEFLRKVLDEKVVAANLPLIGSAEPVSDVLKSLVSGSQNPRILPEDHGSVDLACSSARNSCDEEVMVKTSQLLHQSGAGNCHPDSPHTSDIDQQQSAQDYAQNTTDGMTTKPGDESEDEHVSTSVAPSATTIPNSSSDANDFPFDRTVESGSITFNFDSSPPPMISSRKVSPESSDFQQSGKSLNVPGLDDSLLDSLTGSTRSFFIQHGLGESSISGPLSYSGNISLRSDSSTASTRSFAFPVLHSEWNSSPVKMAKPDRRQLRKHRGWRMALLCCRF
ncbi:hypothetical protein ACLOJK_035215 [Asimina triloba]